MERTYLIQTEGLSKSYGDVLALSNLSVRIDKGSVGLLGPNGSGKTTLIKLLLGLIRPTYGSARVLNDPVETRPLDIRRKVGYMPEVDSFIPEMTGVNLVAAFGTISGMHPGDAYQRAHEVLNYVRLEEKLYDPISTYSQGQKQRVKLAQALVHDPQILFLDEPTNGLDPSGREDMLSLIKSLHRDFKKNILLSSHILPDVEAVCDNVLLLNNGVDLAYEKLSTLLFDERTSFSVKVKDNRVDGKSNVRAFVQIMKTKGYKLKKTSDGFRIHSTKKTLFQDVISAAVESRCELRSLSRTRKTLEEVYIDLMGEAELIDRKKKDIEGEDVDEEDYPEDDDDLEDDEEEEEDVTTGTAVPTAEPVREELLLDSGEAQMHYDSGNAAGLIDLLLDDDADVILDAISALDALRAKGALDPVMELLSHEDASVRQRAKEFIRNRAGGD